MKTETIEQLWESYARGVLPATVSATQRRETRRAFYAGAWSMLTAIMGLAATTEDAGVLAMNLWQQEMERFCIDVTEGKK